MRLPMLICRGVCALVLALAYSTLWAQTPPNDACSNAIDIPVESGSCTSPLYTNSGATTVPSDPIPSCWTPDGPDNTVWFSFTAIGTAVQISTNFGTPVTNTQVAVYSGTCGSLTEMNCQEDLFALGGVTHVSIVVDGLTPGTTYYIMVDGNLGEEGGFSICAEEVFVSAPEPNQDCPTGEFLCDKSTIVVPDGPGNDGLIEEVPSCFGGSGERASHWYIFTAENSGTLNFSIIPNTPSDYDWALFDITGSPTGTCDLTDEIACNWSGVIGTTGMGCGGAACAPTATLTAGNTYALMVDRWTAASSSGFELTFGGTVIFANPDPDFTTPVVCVGAPTPFTNLTSGSNTYSWSFGDGFTSAAENPVHTYASAGVYEVTLIATANPGGCTGVVVQTVTVVEGPELTIDPSAPVICAGDDVPLDLTYVLTTSDCPPIGFENPTDIPIPAGPSISSNINVTGITPATFSPAMLESVCLDIDHGWDADLDISLMCPDGTTIVLSSDNGGAGDDYTGTCFVPSGAPPVVTGSAPFTGDYTPEQPFSTMTGCTVNGTWSLIVDDDLAGFLGTLLGWSITFTCTNDVESFVWTPAAGLSSTSIEDPVASPSTTTTYTVTLTELSGCSASADVTVAVDAPPLAGFVYPASEFCTGDADAAPVTDPGASSGSWSSAPAGLVLDMMDGTIDFSLSAPGAYTITNSVAGVGSCPDAIATFDITIHPSYSIAETVAICSGETYVLPDGTLVSGAGVYTSLLTSVDGCDSIITTTLTVTPTYSMTEAVEICDGGSYTLPDGTIVSAAGTYVSTLTTVDGCDSVVTTTLTLTPTLTTSIDASICDDDSYVLPDGSTASTAGTYSYTFTSTLGCDSVVTVVLTVTPTYLLTEDASICDGGSYTLPDGSVVSVAGTYTSNLTTVDGCDSVVTTTLTVTPTFTTDIAASICDDDTYVLPDGSTTSSAGTYAFTFTSTLGCDSIATVTLTVTPTYSSTEDVDICEGGSYTLPDGSVVSVAGTYISNLTTVDGCDSIVTTTLTLTPTLTTDIAASICDDDTYVLPDGSMTSTAGTYSFTFTSTLGCDSIVNVDLAVTPTYAATEDVEICDGGSYTLPDGSIVSTAGTYTSMLTTVDGCDSVVTTTLTLTPTLTSTIDASICDDDVYMLPDGSMTSTAGTYSFSFTSTLGCDSVVTVDLTLTPTYSLTEDVEICDGGSYTLPDGSIVSTAGTYTSMLTTVDGCDSIVTTTLTLTPTLTTDIAASICDGSSYTLPDGSTTSSAGMYTTTLTTVDGCDSIVTTTLTVTPTYAVSLDTAICDGDTYVLPDGSLATVSGTYTTILFTAVGCDSIITTTLIVRDTFSTFLDVSICSGSLYTLPDGTSVSTAGTYTTNPGSAAGCDSIITVVLEILPVFDTAITAGICPGTTYLLPDGTSTDMEGTYIFNLTTISGCDSIITITLAALPVYDMVVDAVICDDESYVLPDGAIVATAGTYTVSLLSAGGCDSTITTNLSVNPTYSFVTDVSICSGDTYLLEDGTEVSDPGIYVVNINTTAGCDSILITNLNLLPDYNIFIDTAICAGSVLTLPDGTQTDTAGVYSFDYISSLGCDSSIHINVIINDLPVVTMDASTDATCVDGEPFVLSVAPAGGIAWGTGLTGLTFDPAVAGVGGPYPLYYAYTDANGCSDTASLTVEVYALPALSFFFPDYLCVEADPTDLLPVPSGGVFTGPGLSGDMFVPSLAGTGGPYNITYTYTDATGCTNTLIDVIEVRENTVYAGPDTSLFIGDSIQLLVFTSDDLLWSPVTGLSCSDCTDPWASPQQTTTYWLTETDEYGCVAMDALTITVRTVPDMYIFSPNAFTPNGDSANDYFFLYGPDIVRINNLMVYDRWGNLLYHGLNLPANAETLGWDGTKGGLVAMEGVYAFVAEVELKGGMVIPVHGNITLLR